MVEVFGSCGFPISFHSISNHSFFTNPQIIIIRKVQFCKQFQWPATWMKYVCFGWGLTNDCLFIKWQLKMVYKDEIMDWCGTTQCVSPLSQIVTMSLIIYALCNIAPFSTIYMCLFISTVVKIKPIVAITIEHAYRYAAPIKTYRLSVGS